MDINYELYKVFYHVATTLSFSEAARQLYISQSAVSQSVKTLEKKLNTSLFIRSTKNVRLTPEGETLLRHVEPAIHLIKQGECHLMEAGELEGGQLRIGATDTICRHLLIPYLNRYHKKYPKVHIQIINQTSLSCVDLLERGQVDLIVTNYPNSRMGNRQRLLPVHEFRDVFAGNKNQYPELEGRRVSLRELANYPVLMLDRHSTTHEFLHKTFREAQLELLPEIELTSNDLLLDLAGIGLGLAFVPDYCLKGRDLLFKIDLAETMPARKVVVATGTSTPAARSVKEFLSFFH